MRHPLDHQFVADTDGVNCKLIPERRFPILNHNLPNVRGIFTERISAWLTVIRPRFVVGLSGVLGRNSIIRGRFAVLFLPP
jgi:hypothetical protein